MTIRPKILVFSSRESLDIANALQANLEYRADVTVWSQGIFDLSSYPLESLVSALGRANAAVFVFSPDDVVLMRGEAHQAVRDNVVFELGLAIGKLTRDRCFIVMPRERESLRLPTDIIGLTPGDYDNTRVDKNVQAALGPVSERIMRQIEQAVTVEYPDVGRHGRNVLAREGSDFDATAQHSFAAVVPPKGSLRIVMRRTDGKDESGWAYSVGTEGRWVIERYDQENHQQDFNLRAGEDGDLRFHFTGSGRAAVDYFEHGASNPTESKEITWT